MFLHTLLITTDFLRWNRLSGISSAFSLKTRRLFLRSGRPTPTGVDGVGIRRAPCDRHAYEEEEKGTGYFILQSCHSFGYRTGPCLVSLVDKSVDIPAMF